MIKIRNILVPVDFSEFAQKAVRYGLEIARDRKSKVFFLHVINQRIIDGVQELSIKGYKGDFVKVIRQMLSDREKDLDQFVPPDWRQDVETEFVINKGKPADEIIKTAKELNIDLIVVGTQGRSALASALIGSVARNIVNHAPCPVLVVRPVEHEFIA